MTDQTAAKGPDYSQSLYLPKTEFPMRAGLPQKEPQILARWAEMDLYRQLRETSAGRPKFVLHDGPPYANGNIHIGHALNKILKDLVARSQQMLGKDSNYVPGWDCHGLPIEWKIEEEYRAKGLNKDEVDTVEFRRQCRAFAAHWLDVQREEFKRLGVIGDWAHPYATMSYDAEAQIAREILKFAANGLLYRGSKPVMWSVVEKTALAEAEVEYEDHTSDTVWVCFPIEQVEGHAKLKGASVVIWTTTPWTLPANRAVSYSSRIAYGLYEVTGAAENNWAKVGARFVLADKLAADVFKTAKVDAYERIGDVDPGQIFVCRHPLAAFDDGYGFDVPLLDGDHVTDDTGTGFVHTAPSHGREDFDIWMASQRMLIERGIDTRIPYTVDADGFYTDEAFGFGPSSEGGAKRVIDDKGAKGNANDTVIKALAACGTIIARGRLKHQYPHSWRSKKPVIFRNTPQWFIAMDKVFTWPGTNSLETSLRTLALNAIRETRWVPAAGENRINGMIENRPDWVVSRQRAWGVPICVFVKKGGHEILQDAAVNARIADAFEKEGADAWFAPGAAERFLGNDYSVDDYDKVDDVLDVWFDSGSTHAFTLETRPDLKTLRKFDGGEDEIMYLEGSDQHRGWFHSSLLESCGTRGRAPYDVVLTHGFVLDEKGQKMSKSLGNVVAPQTVIKDAGADILRLWVAASDYSDDLRIGKEILKTFVETYRKLRNTIRWMLGTLAHIDRADEVLVSEMPELERLMLHRLAELDEPVREAYANFDYKKVIALLSHFMTSDLSAFYFDIRKDALYCDPPSSLTRRAALATVDRICDAVLKWLAPILAFTCEEAWLDYRPDAAPSIHLTTFPEGLGALRDEALAEKWRQIRRIRSVVTGGLEIERAAKKIGSSLEAAPVVYIADDELLEVLDGVDLAEICITSAITVTDGEGPADAFFLADVPGVSVVPQRAEGSKCARSWKISPLVGTDPEFPDVTPRDAQALRELRAGGQWP
jgi:isoleucyl-tRNA synthetase